MERLRTSLPVLLILAGALLGLPACASSGGDEANPTASGVSGGLGVVTSKDARITLDGLCEMRSAHSSDLAGANGIFYDDVHERLHAIASAAEGKNGVVAATLLEATSKMEADLRSNDVPDSFVADLDDLIDAARTALGVIGFRSPGCGG